MQTLHFFLLSFCFLECTCQITDSSPPYALTHLPTFEQKLGQVQEQEKEPKENKKKNSHQTGTIFKEREDSVVRRRLGVQKGIYSERTSGLCTDGGGSYIGTIEDCEEGAGVLGWSDTTADTTSSSTVPPGCYLIPSNGELIFNTDTSSTTQCKSSFKCACKLTCQAGTYQDQTGQTTCKLNTCLAKANTAAWTALGCVVAGTQDGTTVAAIGTPSGATGYQSCAVTCPTNNGAFVVTVVSNLVTCDTVGGSASCAAAPNMLVSNFGDLGFLLFFILCFIACFITFSN